MTTLDNILNIIIKDKTFINNIKLYLNNIIKDDKIDQYDIPDLVFMITETINSFDSFNLEYNDIPILIRLILHNINEEYKIIPPEKTNDFERVIESSLKLIMLQPKIKNKINGCLSYCTELC